MFTREVSLSQVCRVQRLKHDDGSIDLIVKAVSKWVRQVGRMSQVVSSIAKRQSSDISCAPKPVQDSWHAALAEDCEGLLKDFKAKLEARAPIHRLIFEGKCVVKVLGDKANLATRQSIQKKREARKATLQGKTGLGGHLQEPQGPCLPCSGLPQGALRPSCHPRGHR